MSPYRPPEDERLRRRASFDTAAELYDEARPGYPEALFDDLVALAGIPSGGSVLEIGSGTGKATVPLARRGYAILGIELGANMAARAREKLAPYPNARIEVANFEEWPVPAAAFDLAISASAWHWIDPAIGYPKVAQALRPQGAFALMWSRQQRALPRAPQAERGSPGTADTAGEGDEARDPLMEALRELSARVAPHLLAARRHPHDNRRFARAEELEASGFFAPPLTRTYTWMATYDTASYLRLLDSYSTYRVLDPAVHERLFAEIAILLETRFGGHVTRQWQAELYVARRRA